MYLAWSPLQGNSAVYLASLDSNDRTRLLVGQSKAVYPDSGYLLFHRQGILFAQPFDVKGASLTGEPVRVADEVSFDALNAAAAFDVSDNGRLIYFAGDGPAVDRQFVWRDRTGRQIGNAVSPGLYTTNFDLARDGTRDRRRATRSSELPVQTFWLLDWTRNFSRRLTFDPALSPNGNVVWSPDGRRVAFASQRAGNRDIYERNVNGAGADTVLLATPVDEWPEDWSEDGRYLAYGRNTTQGIGGCLPCRCSGIERPSRSRIRRSARTNPAFRKTADGWPTTPTNQG